MPKLSEARKQDRPRKARRLAARVTDDQHQLFQRAADLQGRSLTDFIVAALQKEAVQTIEAMEIIRLNAEDSRRMAEAIMNPRAPNARLLAAANRYLAALESH